MNTENVINIFKKEFNPIIEKFNIDIVSLLDLDNSNPMNERPGVYIFWNNDKVIRVGRSLYNVKSRSIEVINYFSSYPDEDKLISNIKNESDAKIIYITVSNDEYYWAKSLESYLELKLEPSIKSARR